MEAYERELSLSPGTVVFSTFKRLYEIESMSLQDRSSLTHIKESAERINCIDSTANMKEIEAQIEAKTREFIKILSERF